MTENPKPSYSSYLTQQQMVSDIKRLDRLVDGLEVQIDELRKRIKALEETNGPTQ